MAKKNDDNKIITLLVHLHENALIESILGVSPSFWPDLSQPLPIPSKSKHQPSSSHLQRINAGFQSK